MLWCILVFAACAPWSDADLDGDGVAATEGDCDDGDPTVHPGAADDGPDGVDQDCDGSDGPPACPWSGWWTPEVVYCTDDTDLVEVTEGFEDAVGVVHLELSEASSGCDVVFVADRGVCTEWQSWSMEPLASGTVVLTFHEATCDGDCTCDVAENQTTTGWVEHGDGLRLGPMELPRAPCPVVFELVASSGP